MKKKFFSKRKIIIFIVAAAVLAGAAIVFASKDGAKVSYITDKVLKKDLLETVSEVGAVQSPKQIDLNFPGPGKLNSKLVAIGDKVKAGQVLAQLDFQALAIQRDQAESSLSAAAASLDKLLRGATMSEIAVAQAQAAQAETASAAARDSLDKTSKTVAEDERQAEKTLSDLLNTGAGTPTSAEQAVISAQTALDNYKATYQRAIDNSSETLLNDLGAKLSAVNTALDSIDKIIDDENNKDYLSSKNRSYLDNTKITHGQGLSLLEAANISLALAKSEKTNYNITKASDDASACLKKTADSLDYFYNALINSTFSVQATLDAYKATINTQITAISAAISVTAADRQAYDSAILTYNTGVSAAQNSLNQAQAALSDAFRAAQNALASIKVSGDQKISAAQNSVAAARQAAEVAKKQLAQLLAPARSEDVSLARSKVNDAQSALDLANKQIGDSILKSPIDGQIIRDNYEAGEQVSAAKPVYSVLAENNLEINADISESDIIKVKEGDRVEITLDAFGLDEEFSGEVFFVEPASTVIQDVIYYKVKIKFSDSAEKLAAIRPGMTANVTIITNRRKDVLAVPERAVIERVGGGKIVRVLSQGKISEVPVRTGLRGSDGLIEIAEGALREGETIVVLINTK
jgi:HlyD family secretion protein